MTLAVTQIDPETERLVAEWISLSEAAKRLKVSVGRVKQLIHDHKLVGVRRSGESEPQIPAIFIAGGEVLKGLPGTLTLLADAGYNPVESIRWLFTPDDSLPGTPIDALRGNRGREVKRRAQAMGF